MALATTYTVSSGGGNREDLQDLIKVVDIEKYPLTSIIPDKEKPAATLHEYLMDEIGNVDTTPDVEGADVESFNDQAVNRARAGNYVETLTEPWSVSEDQELVTTAGVPSEVARAKDFAMRKLKRKMEVQIGGDDDRNAGSGSVARVSRALGDFIDSSGPSDINASYRTPSGSINATATASLTEALFNAVLQSVYESGGTSSMALIGGPNLVKAIANFTRVAGTGNLTYRVNQEATTHKMDLKVDLYQGPFNVISVAPTVYNGRASATAATNQSKARGYVIDTDLLGLHYMAGAYGRELENQGGGRRGYTRVKYTLAAYNPKGLGKFNATS
jgi:hypothetical protein